MMCVINNHLSFINIRCFTYIIFTFNGFFSTNFEKNSLIAQTRLMIKYSRGTKCYHHGMYYIVHWHKKKVFWNTPISKRTVFWWRWGRGHDVTSYFSSDVTRCFASPVRWTSCGARRIYNIDKLGRNGSNRLNISPISGLCALLNC